MQFAFPIFQFLSLCLVDVCLIRAKQILLLLPVRNTILLLGNSTVRVSLKEKEMGGVGVDLA